MPAGPADEAFAAIAADLEYPMAVVSTSSGGERAGCLVGFLAQCSIDPPLLMVWLSKRNHTTKVAAGAGRLLVHFLSQDDRELAELFGGETGDEVDKFARCRGPPDRTGYRCWATAPGGSPAASSNGWRPATTSATSSTSSTEAPVPGPANSAFSR